MGKDLLQNAARDWLGWVAAFALSALALGCLLFGFVVAMDPFGLRVSAGRPARPLMDINQRFMYPQLVRSGAFDAAIFGTSTMRLLDPAILSQTIGGRFANLAMNAATPWEQVEMAKLFARATASPKAMIWGIDLPWCDADATAPRNRLTPRPFPPWLYDAPSWADAPRQMNFTTLEIAVRLLGHRLGRLPARIRGDGYEVFTPPEQAYDPAKARQNLSAGAAVAAAASQVPAGRADAAERATRRFPAFDWLEQTLAQVPAATAKLIVLPPIHADSLPQDGSAALQNYDFCKAELAALAGRHGATIIDYARPSSVTRRDDNYWDPLHFRLPVARRVEADLAAVIAGRPIAADGAASVSRPAASR